MAFGLTMLQGDTAPTLAWKASDIGGLPVNLASAIALTFQMVDYYTGDVVVSATATKVQQDDQPATWGELAYYWQPADTARTGLFRAWFVVSFGTGDAHYPLGDVILVSIDAPGGGL